MPIRACVRGARSRDDVLNVGGFSDAVFDALAAVVSGELAGDRCAGTMGRTGP